MAGIRIHYVIAFVAVITAVSLSGQTPTQPTSASQQTAAPQQTATPRPSNAVSPPPTTWTKKTAWGDPDLQGFWNNGTTTPMERPAALGDRTTLSEEEFEARQKADAVRAQGETDADRRNGRGVGAGPTFWYENGRTSRSTSLVIDPPSGRLPAVTPQVREYLAARREKLSALPLDSTLWATQGQWTRCITRGVPGTIPTVYNNNYQIVQAPGYVVLLSEMIHTARIIPTNGKPHLSPMVQQWNGDSRGHWEGQTLVVETTNLRPESEFNRSVVLLGTDAKVTERFTRLSATDMDYRFTVNAPSAFTGPFTLSIPMTTADAPNRIMEYACVEGDHSVALTVTGYIAHKTGKTQGPIPIGGEFPGLK